MILALIAVSYTELDEVGLCVSQSSSSQVWYKSVCVYVCLHISLPTLALRGGGTCVHVGGWLCLLLLAGIICKKQTH